MGGKSYLLATMLAVGLSIPNQSVAQEKPKTRTTIEIVNENDEPLPYANINLNSRQGTISDIGGVVHFYNIKDTTYTLTVSYMGYDKTDFEINVKNGISYPSKVSLKPIDLKGEEIVIEEKAYRDLNAASSPIKPIPKETLDNITFLTGNSHTEKVYALTQGVIPSYGDMILYGADLGDFKIDIDGIETTSNGFFGHDALFFGENAKIEMNTVGMSPKDNRRGLLGRLSARTDMDAIKSNKRTINIDPVRTQFTVSGISNLTKIIDDDAKSKYNLSLEKNIANIWGLNVNLEKDLMLANFKTDINTNSYVVNIFASQSAFSFNNKQYNPIQKDYQLGTSLKYKKIGKKNIFEAEFMSNYLLQKVNYGNSGFLSDEKITQKLTLKNTNQTNYGMFYYGADFFINRYNLDFNFVEVKSISSLAQLALPEEGRPVMLTTIPLYPFVFFENKLSDKILLEYGSTAIIDFLYIKKGVPLGPFIGLSYNLGDYTLKTAATRRMTDNSFDIIRTGDIPFDYSKTKYPKADQLYVSAETENYGLKLSYVNYFNQNTNSLNLNYDVAFLEKYNDYLSLVETEDLLNAYRNFIGNEGSDLSDDELIKLIDKRRETLGLYLNENNINLINTRNRKVIAADLWYNPNKNLFASISFSRATEGSPFSSNSTPYNKDITFSGKIFGMTELFSENIKLAGYLHYRSGFPHTAKYYEPSLAEQMELSDAELLVLKQTDLNAYYDISSSNLIQKKRNNERYPACITSSLSLSYKFGRVFDTFSGQISFSVIDPHLLIPGSKRNVIEIYYDSRGQKRFGRGLPEQYTASLKINF